MYLDTHLPELSHFKLSGLDWEILEGLEAVLVVSHQLNPELGTSAYFNGRFLMHFNNQCLPSQRQFYHMLSSISRCS